MATCHVATYAEDLSPDFEILLIVLVAGLTLKVLWGVGVDSMIGAALASGEKVHLGGDYVTSKLHPEARKSFSVIV